MQTLQYQLQEWLLNSVYDKIYNCRVVKPTYEVNWLYSNKFMLDKRLWTIKINALYKPWYTFTDVVKIKWVKYYLANKLGLSYIIHEWWTILTTWIATDTSSPIRMVTTKWAWWTIIRTGTLTADSFVLDTTTGTPDWWAYVKLSVPWCTTGQYIVFNDWLLKWWTNRIEYVNGNFIYIIWTNSRWTLPVIGQSYTVYQTYSETITVWWTAWAYMYNINWSAAITPVLIVPMKILDMTIFNWQLLVLTDRWIMYSKSTFDWNTNVYPRDLLKWYTWTTLINLGTSVLAIGNKSKSELIKDIRSTNWSIWFVSHQLELTSEMYSKDSYIYKDWLFMMLTKDKRLPSVNIQNINNTLSRTTFNYVDSRFRWLFNNVWATAISNEDWNFVHFMSHTWTQTRIYELDFEYKHWIIQDYNFLVYKKENWEILWTDWVYLEWWYDDLWWQYIQEINFSSWNTLEVYQPYKYIRTIVGMLWTKTDIQLDIELELWAKIKHIVKKYTNYEFDKSAAPWVAQLIWFETANTFWWTIASLQQPILFSARYVRYKYTSVNRFILWDSVVFFEAQESKLNNESIWN